MPRAGGAPARTLDTMCSVGRAVKTIMKCLLRFDADPVSALIRLDDRRWPRSHDFPGTLEEEGNHDRAGSSTTGCSRGPLASAESPAPSSSGNTSLLCSNSTDASQAAKRGHCPSAGRARRRARAVQCRPVARRRSSAIPVRSSKSCARRLHLRAADRRPALTGDGSGPTLRGSRPRPRDGSVVSLAESLGIRRLAMRDVRHFAAVRLRDGRSFELGVTPHSATWRCAGAARHGRTGGLIARCSSIAQ